MILDTETAQQRLLSLLELLSPYIFFYYNQTNRMLYSISAPRTLLGVKYAYSHLWIRHTCETMCPYHFFRPMLAESPVQDRDQASPVRDQDPGFSGSGSGGFSGSGSGFLRIRFSLSGFISSSGGIITSSEVHPYRIHQEKLIKKRLKEQE